MDILNIGEREVIFKSNRVTGEVLIDLLGDEFDYIDRHYFNDYMEKYHNGYSFLYNHHSFDFIRECEDYEDYYDGYNEAYPDMSECYYDELIDEEDLRFVQSQGWDRDVFEHVVTPKYTFVITSAFTTLHRCEVCEEVFCDYNGIYENDKSKRTNQDEEICHRCWSNRCRLKNAGVVSSHAKAMKGMRRYNGIVASRPQRYLAQLLKGEINRKIGSIFADIYLDDHNVVVEYDGGGHWMSVELGKKDRNTFQEEEYARDRFLINSGYKVIRIASESDYLPSDEDILKSIDVALGELRHQDMVSIVVDRSQYDELRKVSEAELGI